MNGQERFTTPQIQSVARSCEPTAEQWDWPLISRRCKVEARRMLRSPQDAEEATQEALARAWRSRRSCRTPDAPIAWCLQITRNEALRVIGRRQNLPQLEPLESGGELPDAAAQGEGERILTRLELDRALGQLAEHERALIALRYTLDYSHPQIAAALDIPEATARVRLHRAHKHLKALVDSS